MSERTSPCPAAQVAKELMAARRSFAMRLAELSKNRA